MNRHVLSILGPNGCGKGTTCKYLAGMGAEVIVASDVLEQYKNKPGNSAVANEIEHHKNVLKQNVPDEIVANAMKWKIKPRFHQRHEGLFALDGFGRGAKQMIYFAEWIGLLNEHYQAKGTPIIKQGHVFFTLGYEESMLRVANRVEEYRKRGEKPREEDLGDYPKQRYDVYAKLEEELIRVARSVTETVLVLDLGKHTTAQAAAIILAAVHGSDEEHFVEQIRSRFEIVEPAA